MWDSLDLAHAMITAHKAAAEGGAPFVEALDPLLEKFETGMLERAREKAEETASNQQMMMSENGASNFVQFFLDAGAAGPHPE